MSEPMAKYYKILSLTAPVTLDDIKTAYLQLAQVWHPDRFPNAPALQKRATEEMKIINEAKVKLCEFVIERDRKAANRAYEIGQSQYISYKWEKAIEYYKKTLQLDPTHLKANLAIALAYHKLEQYGTARPHLKTAREQAPQNITVQFTLCTNLYNSTFR